MKRSQTKDVFDRLTEHDDDPPGPDIESAPDAAATDESASAESESDDGVTQDTTDDDNDTDGGKPPRRLRRRVVAALAGLLLIAALGVSGFLGWRLKQLDDTAAAGRAALDAARNYAVTVTTLDAKDIDKNFNQTLAGATGEFKDAYSQGATQLRQILIDNKAAGKGIVVDAAIKSATKTKVEVLLFVDQSITNSLNPSPRIDRNRVQMTMELVDNRWLASKVEIL